MIRIYKGINKNSRFKIALIIVVAFLIIPVFLAISLGWAKQRVSNAEWTFMVYMDADNNLDYFGYENIYLMETVGSTGDLNIIVLWDKYDDVANLYKIKAGESEIVQGFPLNGFETNMGDLDTLRTFVTYSMKHFRANNYVLVLWDHGDDFRGCCWDDHPYDHLSHQEIIHALSGCSLDILAFDACVEGMIEVAYEYIWAPRGPKIDYIVATEGYVSGWGYPYNTILSALAEEPEINPFEYSKVIVDDYISYYQNLRPASKLVELASIDLTYMIPIVQQLGDLTDVLEGLLAMDDDDNDAYHEMIAEARGEGNLGWSEYGWEAYIDLPTFVKYLSLSEGIPEAATLYITLMDALYVKATEPMQSAEGLGIFFPNSFGSFQNNVFWHGDEYLAMQFPHEGWWDFLQIYWGT
ncbi:MAG: clostripain-related cysteine peptidase [Candidatus Hodarchaeota archaeon]